MFLFTTVTLRTVKEPGDDIFQLTDILRIKNRFSRIHCNCWGEGGGRLLYCNVSNQQQTEATAIISTLPKFCILLQSSLSLTSFRGKIQVCNLRRPLVSQPIVS